MSIIEKILKRFGYVKNTSVIDSINKEVRDWAKLYSPRKTVLSWSLDGFGRSLRVSFSDGSRADINASSALD